MKKLICTMAATVAAIVCFGQYPKDIKCDYSWVIGYGLPSTNFGNTLIKFSANSADTFFRNDTEAVQYYLEGTSISDTSGNLLLHCNGFAVYDSAFNKVPGADSLNCCNTVWQNNYNNGYPDIDGLTILKRPNSENEYWIINKLGENAVTPNQYGLSYALRLTRIIQNNDGTFFTVKRDTFFYEGEIMQKLVELCRHANGRDWWLIQQNYFTKSYYIFLVDPTGIHLIKEQTGLGYIPYYFTQGVFSPDGNKFIIGGMYGEFNDSVFVARYDFDRCTGTLSNPDYYYWKSDSTVVSSGCAISPNSRFLYVATTFQMFQFDLEATNWKATKTIVANFDGFEDNTTGSPWVTTFGRMQLAPDNKLYITAGGTTYLSTIDNPNEPGLACNVNQHSFRLPAKNARTMPNFPNYRMGPIDGSDCDTLGIDNLVNINDKLDNNHEPVKLFPNPASDYITLFVPRITKQWQFALYDIQGRELLHINSRGAFRSLDVSHLTAGMYLWKLVYEDGKVENGKMVKQ